jgi:hypothetical protein
MGRDCEECGFGDQHHIAGTFHETMARDGAYRKWFTCPRCQKSLSVTLEVLKGVGIIEDDCAPQEATSCAECGDPGVPCPDCDADTDNDEEENSPWD